MRLMFFNSQPSSACIHLYDEPLKNRLVPHRDREAARVFQPNPSLISMLVCYLRQVENDLLQNITPGLNQRPPLGNLLP